MLKHTDPLLQSARKMQNAQDFSEGSALKPMLATPVPLMRVFPIMQAQSS